MKADRPPMRVRRPGCGSLLNPRLVPTPLNPEAVPEPILFEPLPARALRAPMVVAAIVMLVARLSALRLVGRLEPRALGQQLAAFCQRMGVLWIKVAQLLSMRVDLLPPEVVEELARLQDRARGVPGEEAVRAIEANLGGSIDRHFTDFEPAPFAAASIAQVHRARLRDSGVLVAIKVRRPGVEQAFASDMRVLRGVVRLLEAFSIRPHAGWNDLLWEAETIIGEELDYRIEASNQRRLRKALRRQRVYVPKIFSRLCGEGILVMEYLPGVLMSDYLRLARADRTRLAAWQAENNIDPRQVGNRLLRSYLRQLLEDNFFHSDLHPGNVMLLRDGRLALLDCGSLSSSEREFLRRYELFIESIVSNHHATAADVFLLFARNLPAIDLAAIRQELVEAIQAWVTRSGATALPFDERATSRLVDQLVRVLDTHGIAITWSFLRIGRAWTTMDASLRELAPRQDWRPAIARYFRRKERRARAAAFRTIVASAGAAAPFDLPRLLYERSLFRGTVVRRLAQVFEGSTTVVAQVVARGFAWLARAHVVAAVVLLVVGLSQYEVAWARPLVWPAWESWVAGIPRLDPQVWLLVFIVLAQGWRLSRHLRRQFAVHSADGGRG